METHCVGFSLGGVTCSFSGKTMKEMGNPLDRITGIDSAGFWLYRLDTWGWGDKEIPNIENTRLSAGDAKFVDWYHSNGIGVMHQGSMKPAATVNIYLGNNGNYGGPLPGCENNSWGAMSCSHFVPNYFFIESIKNKDKYKVNQKCTVNYATSVLKGCSATKDNPKVGYYMSPDAKGSYTVDVGDARKLLTKARMAMWYGYTDTFPGEWTDEATQMFTFDELEI
jgi:hypothetical protein